MSNPFEALEKRLSSIEDCLSKLTVTISKFHPQEEIDTIDVAEVAKMLNLSESTIYTKTSKKLIPHTKRGKKLIFSRKRILAYIAEGEVKTFHQEFKETEKLVAYRINRKQQIATV